MLYLILLIPRISLLCLTVAWHMLMCRYLFGMSKSLAASGSAFTHWGLVLNMMFTIVHPSRSPFHEIQNAQNNQRVL